MFGYSLKFDLKLTLRTLKHNKFYPPGVGEDGGLGIPEGRNRVTNSITSWLWGKKELIKINAILNNFGHSLKFARNRHSENWNRTNCTCLMLVKMVEFG